jgi:putative ribosome biogenesis GTPase RsgA
MSITLSFLKIPAIVCMNKFDLNPEEEKAIEAFAKQKKHKGNWKSSF